MNKIAIIGGGLAGLTAAYYISELEDVEVDLYEAEPVLGGRVQTVEVNGFHFNTGAFMIFPWYKSFKKLLKDIEYTHAIEPLHIDHEYIWDESDSKFQAINQLYPFQGVTPKTIARILPTLLSHKAELYNPDPTRFDGETVAQYLEKLSPEDIKSLEMLNKLLVGYTYGNISQLPLSIYFGFAKEILLHDGFKKVSILTDGAHKIVDEIEERLRSNGVNIYLDTQANITNDRHVQAKGVDNKYNMVVLANGHKDTLGKFIEEENGIEFTDHYTVLLHTNEPLKVNGNYDWSLVYTARLNESSPQLTCIGNIEKAFDDGPDNSLITYLRVPAEYRKKFDTSKAKQVVKKQITKFFPEADESHLDHIHHWKRTMPILSPATLENIQKIQGKNGVYYAGDYMGAPSMEVAVQSGVEVSRLINQALK